MRTWAFILFTAAAVGAATVVASAVVRRDRHPDDLEALPDILADCYDRIEQIERDLGQLKPGAETPGEPL